MTIKHKKEWDALFEEIHESVEISLKAEPILMRAKRVEEILDIESSTRKRLVNSGDLTALKTGNAISSAMRITKESVIATITKWQTNSEYKEALK